MQSAKIPGEEGPRPDIGLQGPLNPHGSAFTKQLKWLHCLRGFQGLRPCPAVTSNGPRKGGGSTMARGPAGHLPSNLWSYSSQTWTPLPDVPAFWIAFLPLLLDNLDYYFNGRHPRAQLGACSWCPHSLRKPAGVQEGLSALLSSHLQAVSVSLRQTGTHSTCPPLLHALPLNLLATGCRQGEAGTARTGQYLAAHRCHPEQTSPSNSCSVVSRGHA